MSINNNVACGPPPPQGNGDVSITNNNTIVVVGENTPGYGLESPPRERHGLESPSVKEAIDAVEDALSRLLYFYATFAKNPGAAVNSINKSTDAAKNFVSRRSPPAHPPRPPPQPASDDDTPPVTHFPPRVPELGLTPPILPENETYVSREANTGFANEHRGYSSSSCLLLAFKVALLAVWWFFGDVTQLIPPSAEADISPSPRFKHESGGYETSKKCDGTNAVNPQELFVAILRMHERIGINFDLFILLQLVLLLIVEGCVMAIKGVTLPHVYKTVINIGRQHLFFFGNLIGKGVSVNTKEETGAASSRISTTTNSTPTPAYSAPTVTATVKSSISTSVIEPTPHFPSSSLSSPQLQAQQHGDTNNTTIVGAAASPSTVESGGHDVGDTKVAHEHTNTTKHIAACFCIGVRQGDGLGPILFARPIELGAKVIAFSDDIIH